MTKPEPINPSAFPQEPLDPSMFELFCQDLETECKALSDGLIAIERNPHDHRLLESLMRAGHSIKGAARVVNLGPIVRLAHAMEDCFSSEKGGHPIESNKIDTLLRCTDLFFRLSKTNAKDVFAWLSHELPVIESLIDQMAGHAGELLEKLPDEKPLELPSGSLEKLKDEKGLGGEDIKAAASDRFRMLRITAENLNHLLGLAGETLVESRRLYPLESDLERFKNQLVQIEDLLISLSENLRQEKLNESAKAKLGRLHGEIRDLHHDLNRSLIKFDDFLRRYSHLSDQLYQEVVGSRMRPFADGIEAFPRLVRDLARQMGKRVRLLVNGEGTLLDREILEKLEAPIAQLLRNAVDHGIEPPETRAAAGKPEEGTVTIDARHQGGMLAITISDDGKGADIEKLRQKIVEEKIADSKTAAALSDADVVNCLFLPGFSTSTVVTEISGRGVGLNIVQKTVLELGGTVSLQTHPGIGMSFHLRLPLTLSVIRALLVEISGEAYAFALAQIDEVISLPREKIELIENHPFFRRDVEAIKLPIGEKKAPFSTDALHLETQREGNIGLIHAWEVLELSEPPESSQSLPVIILSSGSNVFGLAVDRIVGELELVVEELDERLGKIRDISAGALLEDGSVALIVDIPDIVRSIAARQSSGFIAKLSQKKPDSHSPEPLRILVVDDSSTVREVESRLLLKEGYFVDTAVDGLDGWNALRAGHYDLVITDIEMPRMDGIELLKAIKKDPSLRTVPVMIVSYKAGDADRKKGLDEGAADYLTKNSFQDTSLIDAVKKLIGDSRNG